MPSPSVVLTRGPLLSPEYVRFVRALEADEDELLRHIGTTVGTYGPWREGVSGDAREVEALREELLGVEARFGAVEPPGGFWRFARHKERFYAGMATALHTMEAARELRNARLLQLGLRQARDAYEAQGAARAEWDRALRDLGG